MAQLHRRRLLFVQAPRGARLTAIYLAIAALVFVSLVDFIVAYRPDDSTASASSPAEGRSAATSESFHGSLREPPGYGRARAPGRWM